MIQKYQKKPVTIEAIRFTEENLPIIKEWLGENLAQLSSEERHTNPQYHWIIRDYLEGDMKITEGDYIIKGVNGEFYNCNPDRFYATYDGPVKVLWDHTTREDDKEWLLPRAFKKESGEHIPNGYNVHITEKLVEKISEDEARIREILKDPSSVFVGLSAEGLHVWINQAKKYYIEPELNRINRIQY